jgi:hypothetical protein
MVVACPHDNAGMIAEACQPGLRRGPRLWPGLCMTASRLLGDLVLGGGVGVVVAGASPAHLVASGWRPLLISRVGV